MYTPADQTRLLLQLPYSVAHSCRTEQLQPAAEPALFATSPADYPAKPPRVHFPPGFYHPNVFPDGNGGCARRLRTGAVAEREHWCLLCPPARALVSLFDRHTCRMRPVLDAFQPAVLAGPSPVAPTAVCLSIINPEKGWRPSITVKQILVGVQVGLLGHASSSVLGMPSGCWVMRAVQCRSWRIAEWRP